MELPQSMRDNLVEELDDYLDAVSKPEAESVTAYLIEMLETFADDMGIDDIVGTLEEEGALDDSLTTTLEEEMESNDEFEYTGEEIASLLERLCNIEWIEDEEGEEQLEDEDEGDAEDEDGDEADADAEADADE